MRAVTLIPAAVTPLPPLSLTRKLFPLVALLAGCSYVPMVPGISPFKIDIQQGNYVTQDMVAKVNPGMSKAQVRFALGTPLIVDPFHNDRWDYVYELQKRGRIVEHRRIIAVFQDDKLVSIDGVAAPAAPGSNTGAGSIFTGAGAAAPKTATETPVKPAPAVTGTLLEPASKAGTDAPSEKPSQR